MSFDDDPRADEGVDPAAPERLRVDRQRVPVPPSSHWLPGPAWAWVLGAAAVFVLAAVLAFSTNNDDGAVVATQTGSVPAVTAAGSGSASQQAEPAEKQNQLSESMTDPQDQAEPETGAQLESDDESMDLENVPDCLLYTSPSPRD